MKKLILSLFFFTAILNAGVDNDMEAQMKQIKKMSAEDFAKNIARETSKVLPMRLDAVTTVIKSLAIGKSIQYTKTIDQNNAQVQELIVNNKEKFKKAMFEQDSKMVCYNEMLNYMIVKKNLVLRYFYTDKNHKPIFNYSVNKQDCLKLK